MKYGTHTMGCRPIVRRWAMASLETKLIITPDFGYGMVVIPTKYVSTSPTLSHFFWVIGVVGFQHVNLKSLEVVCASVFSSTWKCELGTGRVAIVESLRQGESASLCYKWKPASSSATISSSNILVPIFTNHMLGTIGQSNTYFVLFTLT